MQLTTLVIDAWRGIRARFRKSPAFFVLDIASLAAGLAAAFLVSIYAQTEFSFDSFITKRDNVVRLSTLVQAAGRSDVYVAASMPALGPLLETLGGGQLQVARIARERLEVKVDGVNRREPGYSADPKFLSIITLPIVAGSRETALQAPDSVVLTESAARRTFGTEVALDREIVINGHVGRVLAVLADPPRTSQFAELAIIVAAEFPTSQLRANRAREAGLSLGAVYTFARGLQEGLVDLQALATRATSELTANLRSASGGEPPKLTTIVVPFGRIHLDARFVGEIGVVGDSVLIWSLVALSVLLITIGCANFVNLATARSVERGLEVSVLRALGVSRSYIAVSCIAESIACALLAMVAAVVLGVLLLPWFSAVVGRTLQIPLDPIFWGCALATCCAVGIIAGVYPGTVLASFRPAEVLHGRHSEPMSIGVARFWLVAFQFLCASSLAVATIVVHQQFQFVTSRSLGFDPHDVAVIVPDQVAHVPIPALITETVKNQGVKSASAVSAFPTGSFEDVKEVSTSEGDRPVSVVASSVAIAGDYLGVIGARILSGRSFEQNEWLAPSSDVHSVVINEKLAHALGFSNAADAVDRTVNASLGNTPTAYRVVGVVANFPIRSIREVAPPAIFYIDPTRTRVIAVRLESGASIGEPANVARGLVSDTQFSALWLDTRVDQAYADIDKQRSVAFVLSVLAVIVACIGQVGIAAHAARRRVREVAIRKALGAYQSEILRLVLLDFLRPVAVGILIATPLSVFLLERWLTSFTYRIQLGFLPFVGAALISVVLAYIVTFACTRSLAKLRPAHALRIE